jgi:tetratricopeptide (TPR) repeat protein
LPKPAVPRRGQIDKSHHETDFAALRLAGEDLLDIGERDGNASALLRAADRFREALAYGTDTSVLQNNIGNALIRCAHLNNSVELAREAHIAFQSALRAYNGSQDDAFALRIRLNILECSCQISSISGNTRLIRFSISSLRDFTAKFRETISPDRARAEALLAEALLAHRDTSRDPDGDLKEALSAYENSINIYQDNDNSKNQTDRAINQTRYALALTEVGDFDKAIDYCIEAATNLKLMRPTAWADARLSLADIYILQGGHYLVSEPGRARQLLEDARNIAEDISSSRSIWQMNIIAKATSRTAKATGLLALLEPYAERLKRLNQSISFYNKAIPYLSSCEQLSFSKEKDIILSTIELLTTDSSVQLLDGFQATDPMKSRPQELERAVRAEAEASATRLDIPAETREDFIDRFITASLVALTPQLPVKPPERYIPRGSENIIQFLRRVWEPWIQPQTPAMAVALARHGRLLTRSKLREIDISAAQAVDAWLSPNRRTGARRTLPEDIFLPTLPELDDLEVSLYAKSAERPARLDAVVRNRAWRSRLKK